MIKISAFHIFCIVFLTILEIVCFLFLSIEGNAVLLKIFYVLFNIYILYIVKLKYGSIFNILTIFIGILLFFNGSRIVLDLIGFDNMRYFSFIFNGTISEEVNNRAILNVNLGIVALSIGYFLYRKKEKKIEPIKYETYGFSNISCSMLWCFFVIGFVVKILMAYLSFSFLLLFTYMDMPDGINFPRYLYIISCFPVFVSLYNLLMHRGKFWVIALIIYGILDMAGGHRGPGMLIIVLTLFLCVKINYIKLSISKIAIFFLLCSILLSGISQIRNGHDFNLESDFFIRFFWGQGVSIDVLQLSIQEYDKLDYSFFDMFGTIRHYIDSLFNRIPDGDGSTLSAAYYKQWSFYITYMINPSMYYQGFGLGGNYLGQLFAVGKESFVFCGNLFVGFFLHFLERKLFSPHFYTSFIVFNILCSIIYLPRDNMFDFITDLFNPIVVVLIMTFAQRILCLCKNSNKIIALNIYGR